MNFLILYHFSVATIGSYKYFILFRGQSHIRIIIHMMASFGKAFDEFHHSHVQFFSHLVEPFFFSLYCHT